LIQQYVQGREFTVSIDGDRDSSPRVLVVSEIITGQDFFDYEAKYSLKNTTEITPAEVDTALQEKIENIAL
jgi:D-alanine-D-alanine ligase